MTMQNRTYCKDIDESLLGQELKVCGWVHKTRDHGKVIFIDLRDVSGIVQCVIEEKENLELYEIAKDIKEEFVLCIKGIVRRRPPGTENPRLKSGNVELNIKSIEIINTSKTPPFPIEDNINVSEELRLKYRYIDLRRDRMKNSIIFRSKALNITRNFFHENGFFEIETPFLVKSTPEGARDFIVPSRINPGKFYALPQSPQLFKQTLMISGFDRYFQIARCFRDEDLRSDRQPEFTQIDIEMSFVNEDDVISVSEAFLKTLFKEMLNIDIETPFKRITYKEAMEKYGSDKPDIRFSLELTDLSDIFKNTSFNVFKSALENGGIIKALKINENITRKDIDELTEYVKSLGAKGLAWGKVENSKFSSPIAKFLSEKEIDDLISKLSLKEGDFVFFSADKPKNVYKILGNLRTYIAKKYDLIPKDEFKFLWVVDFPLFEWDEEENRLISLHHPFTSPKEEDIEKLDKILESSDKKHIIDIGESMKAKAYDIVLNGVEIGGGSIRIHNKEIQEKVFKVLNISSEEIKEKFGFLIEALEYGAPTHGGIAFGFDRILAMMQNFDSIRDVIAFPKTQKGLCLLTSAPDYVSPKQLKEVHIKLDI